jgi:hypothetical protein
MQAKRKAKSAKAWQERKRAQQDHQEKRQARCADIGAAH